MRMSQRELDRRIEQILSTAAQFDTDEGREIITAAQAFERGWLSGGPSVTDLNAITNRLNQLVWDRLQRSESLPPTIEPSVSVTLWGTAADDAAEAWEIAARSLNTHKVTPVDNTHIRTADRVGTRYVFRAVSA